MIKHSHRRPGFYLLLLALLFSLGWLRLVTAQTEAGTQTQDSPPREAAWQTRLRELNEQVRDPHVLLLRTGSFDPLTSEPAAVRLGARQLETTSLAARAARWSAQARPATASQLAYYLVQFSGVIRPEQTASLRASGYEIVGYVANNAYIVRAPQTSAAKLQAAQARGQFRWLGAYGAGLKIEPELVQTVNEMSAASATLAEEQHAITFISFTGADVSTLRDTLAGLALTTEPILEERFDGRVRGLLFATQAELPRLVLALAEIEGVEWIQRRRAYRRFNDVGVRLVQSGNAGTDTPLYRRGLTGAGQVYGTADSGLDTDHAQFRLSGEAAAQTLSFAVTNRSLVEGLLPVNLTNPNNKVLAYYLLGVGNLIDNAANPHGGKTLDPNQRSGTGANAVYFNAVAYDDSDAEYHGTATTSVAAGRDYNADGTGALPGLAARTAGDGVAPEARIVFQDVGHVNGTLAGLNMSWALLHQQAYDSGVRVHNNSYGGTAPIPYDSDAADVDDSTWRLRDYSIFFAAGNDGPGSATLGSASKNDVLVAATSSPTDGGNFNNLEDFSSHGPTTDGRLKPDIAAPGVVRAAWQSGGIGSTFGPASSRTALDAAVNPANPDNNRSLAVTGGTSFSSPMAAGAALLARQYFTDGFYPSGAANSANGFVPSNALIKGILLNSGQNMGGRYTASDGTGGARGVLPNFGQGWGRLALDDALYFPGDRRELKILADIYNGATASDSTRHAPNPAITTGEIQTYQIANVSTVEPLRLTLVWSDPPAVSSTAVALVNNLDLEVIDPQGTVYRGNGNFGDAWSQPAGGPNGLVAFDNRNPVEAVYIQFPQPGVYTVRIIGDNVPGNGQMQVLAQPGNQRIDSNRQGYALVATGNFTAGAQPLAHLAAASISGGVNADQYISRNETVTAQLTVNDPTVIPATGVTAQIAVAAASTVPASVVKLNGQAAGQPITLTYGALAALESKTLAFQVTLLDDGINRAGQAITFDVTLALANGGTNKSQFTLIAQQRLLTYRTRFEPTTESAGDNTIVIPASAWSLRPDNPYPAAAGSAFAGLWQLTTSLHAAQQGSTASLGDPSGVGASYGVSTTSRTGLGVLDDTRWWTTQKIVLPGFTVNQSTGRVSNPEFAAQLNAAIESFDVDISADFTGDTNRTAGLGDLSYLRVRPYKNTASLTATDDSGFNDASFTNLLLLDSTTPTTEGFKHFSGSNFPNGSGVFAVDTVTPNNSDVAFRLEVQLRRNNANQTGEGVFYDNLEVHLRVADTTVYNLPTAVTASVDAASFARAAAPGQLLALFGTGLPNFTGAAANLPLPTQLGNVAVRVNGRLAPLFFVSAANGSFQINYQLPFETLPGTALIEVLDNGVAISNEFLNVSAAAPGVFTTTANGQGQAIALNQDFSPNSASRPEARNRFIIVFANGQGAELVNAADQQALTLGTGAAAPGAPLFATKRNPTVTIGGVPATVSFSGLAPGFVGLWQLNVQVPANAPVGNNVPLVISTGERASSVTTVALN
jgi:uncharacterized protein (TIGR03437 family)